MRFALCVSQASELQQLRDFLSDYMTAVCAQSPVDTFQRFCDLLDAWEPEKWPVIVLDTNCMDKQAWNAARELRQRETSCRWILLSDQQDHALAGFSLHPVDLMTRPVDRSQLDRALERCRDSWADALCRLEVSNAQASYSVALYDILFARMEGRKCLVTLRNWEPQAMGLTMSELEKRLDDSHFFCCHRSYLVNLCHVVELDAAGAFILSDGSRIPIGRDRLEAAATAFHALTK